MDKDKMTREDFDKMVKAIALIYEYGYAAIEPAAKDVGYHTAMVIYACKLRQRVPPNVDEKAIHAELLEFFTDSDRIAGVEETPA